MKPVQIPASDDERTLIPFSLPVKGRKPLTFKVPRFEWIPEPEFDELTKKIDALAAEEGSNLRKYTRALALLMLKEFVPDKDFAVLEKAPTGQLNLILAEWRLQSEMTLGESDASETSSPENTEAPSDTTSKPDSESSEETSDDA